MAFVLPMLAGAALADLASSPPAPGRARFVPIEPSPAELRSREGERPVSGTPIEGDRGAGDPHPPSPHR